MEICQANDAFKKGNNNNDKSTKTQVQLFLEEVMQEVEIVMDDLSVVTQNVTVKLSSTITDYDTKFCPSSSLYLQAQVQSFLDEIYMKVNEQISSTLTPFGFPDTDELTEDEEQVDVGDSNASNHFDKADSDNEVKTVMSNILDNLKDLLCQEDNKCASVQNDMAISDSTTHKRKVADEIEPVIKKVKLYDLPQEILMEDDNICVEKANKLIIKEADLKNKVCEKFDVMIPVDNKITLPKVEELPTNVNCDSLDDTVSMSQETNDMTKEQNETDRKDCLPESKHNELPPELNNEQSSQNVCAENRAFVCQVPSTTNQENESTKKHKPDDEALKLRLPTENMHLIPMADHLQPEGSKKRSMQDTLSASPEKKTKVSDPVNYQNSQCASSAPKDRLQTEVSQKRSMQDTVPATLEKKAKVFDSVQDQKSTSSAPNSNQFILQNNVPTSTDEKNNGRNCVEKCEMIITNDSEHGEENMERKNKDQTVPSLIPAKEEVMQHSENGIVADASLYTSVGNSEKVEEKLQSSASGGVNHITETQDDSIKGQNNEEDTGSQMVPSIHDSEAVADILQTLQYHSQQPSTVGVPPLLMPVFNVGQQKATGPLERLPPIPSCTRRKRVGLSRRQAIPHLHTVSRELKPLVPKETEQ